MNKPYSSTILVLCSIILMGLGLYFVFLRAPLLPEDLRYMDASLAEIQAAAPGLLKWLQKVFWVLGGYSFTSGLLTLSSLSRLSVRVRAVQFGLSRLRG